MKQSFIHVKSLSKSFGDYNAIESLEFEVPAGEILAIIGPNGSGKSTLARIIVGLEEPTTGQVLIDGKDSISQVHRIGYVPQHFPFDRTIPITVREFLALVPCPTKEHQAHDSVMEALKIVGMEKLAARKLGVLSGGELQRVLVARALLHERDILVLDEPATGIDVSGEQAIYDLLSKVNKEKGTTIIVISHEIDFVTKYATKVVCLNRQMVCHGVPAEVLSSETMSQLYGEVKHFHHSDKHKG